MRGSVCVQGRWCKPCPEPAAPGCLLQDGSGGTHKVGAERGLGTQPQLCAPCEGGGALGSPSGVRSCLTSAAAFAHSQRTKFAPANRQY